MSSVSGKNRFPRGLATHTLFLIFPLKRSYFTPKHIPRDCNGQSAGWAPLRPFQSKTLTRLALIERKNPRIRPDFVLVAVIGIVSDWFWPVIDQRFGIPAREEHVNKQETMSWLTSNPLCRQGTRMGLGTKRQIRLEGTIPTTTCILKLGMFSQAKKCHVVNTLAEVTPRICQKQSTASHHMSFPTQSYKTANISKGHIAKIFSRSCVKQLDGSKVVPYSMMCYDTSEGISWHNKMILSGPNQPHDPASMISRSKCPWTETLLFIFRSWGGDEIWSGLNKTLKDFSEKPLGLFVSSNCSSITSLIASLIDDHVMKLHLGFKNLHVLKIRLLFFNTAQVFRVGTEHCTHTRLDNRVEKKSSLCVSHYYIY